MMNFMVEAWAPEYGVSVDSQQMDDSTETVDITVEVSAKEWQPIDPEPLDTPNEILFVDGVRRVDARVWITDEYTSNSGVCASVAAGTVRCNGAARVEKVSVFRGLFASKDTKAEDICTAHGDYTLVECADDSPEQIYLGIHQEMTRLEKELAADDTVELVVFDGPLRGRQDHRSVGYIKTQHVEYLPPEQHRTISLLKAGQRTPVFRIGAGAFSRWSIYLRLPGTISHPLANIVRCEFPGALDSATAIERSNVVAIALQRFASEPHKDSRAPQNLYPIAGLETQLRHRLGDSALMERALRKTSVNN